jgi:hypothetical protein
MMQRQINGITFFSESYWKKKKGTYLNGQDRPSRPRAIPKRV